MWLVVMARCLSWQQLQELSTCVFVRHRHARDSVIIHHYCVKNLIHRFDDSNYLWQAALLYHLGMWTRRSLALHFSFPLTPVALLDRYGKWQWWNFIWFAHETLHAVYSVSRLYARDGNSPGIMTRDVKVRRMVWTQRTKKQSDGSLYQFNG